MTPFLEEKPSTCFAILETTFYFAITTFDL
jgi:hypothetical protein